MRVIAGTLGGRRLKAPPGRATRPTSDRVREALFSMLGEVAQARVLDLYEHDVTIDESLAHLPRDEDKARDRLDRAVLKLLTD